MRIPGVISRGIFAKVTGGSLEQISVGTGFNEDLDKFLEKLIDLSLGISPEEYFEVVF